MKNSVNVLIGLSVIGIVIAIISKVTQTLIFGIGPKGIVDSVGVLLLLAIALSVKK
jgi:hypothetical protein